MATSTHDPKKFDQITSIVDAIFRARTHSPFLAQLIDRQPEIVALLKQGDFAAAISLAHNCQVEGDAGATLRKQRQGVALVTAIADLSGAWDLAKVTRTLSDFADHAVETAITAAFAERLPGATVTGFTVIALGKHGGRELNYSSDIDPIFLYDPKTLPHREREDVADSAVRIGRRVIELLSVRDEHGYVFRVDMRLRPSPEVSPITIPVEGAISYYESSALAWEQAAFIRSRICAGDKELGHYFLKSIQPFIWRRSLDFGQLKHIQAMSAQIRDHYSKGQILGPGYDLKRGRGGIRECEFYAQVHQLIHGGRDAALRMADTATALTALAEAKHIEPQDAEALKKAYILLRSIEHRLQMVDDRQTHNLPEADETLNTVARLHGLQDGSELVALLAPHIAAVTAIYDGLAGQDGETQHLADQGLPLEEQLRQLGYSDPANVAQRLTHWRSGTLRAIRSDSARQAFEDVIPEIMAALSAAPDPDRALARFDNLIEALPSAVNFFHLLKARPGLLKLVAEILSYAPTLADALARRASLLDGLIDASALDLPGSKDVISKELSARIGDADYERLLDISRAFVGEKRFALGVQLIEGRQDPVAVSHAYADLAEVAVQTLTAATIAEFERVHGKIKEAELIILALGRLGGGALTHASDLDLILLFTGEPGGESDGDRPLATTQYFNRLAQRIIAALSVQTASGALYEIDTRLRPSGAQGLLCASLDSFAKYQQEEAWTWEHMALTRARVIYGSDKARISAQTVIDAVLSTPRDNAKLIGDITAMRADMAEHKPPKGALDMKLLPGGLVDAEFTVHALQLRHNIAFYPDLEKAISALINTGFLPASFAAAHQLLSQTLVLLRLVAPDNDIPSEAAQNLIAHALDVDDWNAVQDAVDNARAVFSTCWTEVQKLK